jgi:hypothetical protein
MEGVKSLECSPEELLGVEGAERTEGDGGNWGGPPRPGGLRSTTGQAASYNRREPGSGRRAGRASEAAVVPIEPDGQHNRR